MSIHSVVIIGAQASGKMTVGQALAQQSDLILFHNHASIDFVMQFVPDWQEARAAIKALRFSIFQAVAQSASHPGLIFTVLIDFADSADVGLLEEIQAIFQQAQKDVLFVELVTSLEERLRRNQTENRLKHKPLKRDIKWSETDLLTSHEKFQLESVVPPKQLKHYLKIENTELTANEVATQIQAYLEQRRH